MPTSPKANLSPEALQDFLAGVEEEVDETSRETIWSILEPEMAEATGGAEPPPSGLSDPVWSPSAGWMERGSAPIGDDTDEPLAFTWTDPNNIETP